MWQSARTLVTGALPVALTVLACLLTPTAQAKPAKPAASVSAAEARRFGAEQESLGRQSDLRALKAYRPNSALMVLTLDDATPKVAVLKGRQLQRFLRQSLAEPEAIPSAASCHYEALTVTRVLETCAIINVQKPVPAFSLSIVERDRGGLYFSTMLWTTSATVAQRVHDLATGSLSRGESDDDGSDDDGDASTPAVPVQPGDLPADGEGPHRPVQAGSV